ncbi:MAG TPA: PD-(D/E)XK nuclease-like domain-containing protein [Planctomycetota bacterium]|nr:PD-(D/E)XK nuclease-like domain-containing protein [Planctomycetota bacterium]
MNPVKWQGKPIAYPGIYTGLPIHIYHSAGCCVEPSISSSGLRTIINKSPAHYFDTCPYNKNRPEDADQPSDAMVLGRATHHLLLGEAEFKKQFAIRPERFDSWRTGDSRKWRAAAQRDGFTVLVPSDIERIRGMAAQLARHTLVQAGILNGAIEQSFVWKEEHSGVWLKARPDAVPSDSNDYVDLKTTASVQYQDIRTAIAEYGYHQQGALVREGARRLTGAASDFTFTLVFVESKRPHCVRIVTLKDADLDRGHKLNVQAVRLFAKCMQSGRWPGPGDERADAEFVELPEWRQKQIDEMKIEQ